MIEFKINQRSQNEFFVSVIQNNRLIGFLGYNSIDRWRFVPADYMFNVCCFKRRSEALLAIEEYSGSDYYI